MVTSANTAMTDFEQCSDVELLEAWRGGAAEAGDVLLRRHFARIYRFFERSLGASASEIEDLTQRTFEACIAGRDRVRTDFRGYLFGVARRQLMREWERRRMNADSVTPSEAGVQDARTSPSGVVARAHRNEKLREATDALPLEFKAVLERFYWGGKTIPEIAEELGIAKGTVKSRLFRGKALLKQELENLGVPLEIRELLTK